MYCPMHLHDTMPLTIVIARSCCNLCRNAAILKSLSEELLKADAFKRPHEQLHVQISSVKTKFMPIRAHYN